MKRYNKENASPAVMHAFDLEFEKGFKQGREFIKRETAKKSIINNIPLELIVEVTELTLEEVKEIRIP